MVKSSLYDYSGAYILVKGTITVANIAVIPTAASNTNNKVIFKHFTSFICCISKINKTQLDNAKDIHEVMPMYNFQEHYGYIRKVMVT